MQKTLEATTQLAMRTEAGNRTIPKRHYKSRFSFFKYPRLRYEFYTNDFYSNVRSA